MSGCSLLVDTSKLAGNGTGTSDAGVTDGAITQPDASADGGSVAATDAGGDALASTSDGGGSTFIDDFNRADGPVGNGWTQKTNGAFILSNGQAHANMGALSYRSALMYRPLDEDARDVQVSVVVTTPTFANVYPQLHARVQRATIAASDVLDSYGIVITGDPKTAVVFQQHGGGIGPTLGQIALTPALATNVPFRFRLRVVGASPVIVDAWVESTGPSGATLGHGTYSDSSGDQITGAGTVGISTDTDPLVIYDDFRRDTL
jgi:hypothetical protein